MPVVAGIAVLGPGLPGWAASRDILAGAAAWREDAVVLPQPALLAPTERRRTGAAIRLALALAAEAASGAAAGSLRTVFGSGNGDSQTVCAILEELCRPQPLVSPTQFHNSVHNAGAGYWSIGARSVRPATCLGCHDWTFAAALMKAVAECAVEQEPVLLCVSDVPMPAPLAALRPTTTIFGVALLLAPDGAGPRVSVQWDDAAAQDCWPRSDPLRRLAEGNPAARSLRLLECLAQGGAHRLDLALLDGRLLVGPGVIDIAALVPHAGAMCLLDEVIDWSETAIACRASSHLRADNPLRREGCLPAVCGIEYALQAAALHGALLGGGRQQGFLAALRLTHLAAEPIDDPSLGTLRAEARRDHGTGSGLIYTIGLLAQDGRTLLAGRATIALA